jgi:hypothetical protein
MNLAANRRPLVQVASACLASVVLYIAAFAFVLHKPLTLGLIQALGQQRLAYAAAHPGPKVVIIAGSNGMYSFRCQAMEPILGRPCVNLALGAHAGLDYDFERVRAVARRGDVVVMPYEFEIYSDTPAIVHGGVGSAMAIQADRSLLRTMPAREIAEALFSFDFRFFVDAVMENVFTLLGIHGNFTLAAFTPQGDFADATPENARVYADSVAKLAMAEPTPAALSSNSAARPVFEAFMDWARRTGIQVVGSLPTTFNDRPHDPALVRRIAQFYRDGGGRFVVLANQHQYPHDCFFDSNYHLAEICQIPHSRAFAEALVATGLPAPP